MISFIIPTVREVWVIGAAVGSYVTVLALMFHPYVPIVLFMGLIIGVIVAVVFILPAIALLKHLGLHSIWSIMLLGGSLGVITPQIMPVMYIRAIALGVACALVEWLVARYGTRWLSDGRI